MEKKVWRIIGFLWVLLVLVACASESEDSASDSDSMSWADSDEMRVESEIAWFDEDADEADFMFASEEAEVSGVLEAIPILLPSESGRQLSYTVTFHLTTVDFELGMRLLFDTVGDFDGYSVRVTEHGRSLSQPDAPRTADFLVRIPNEHLSAFIVFVDDHSAMYNRIFFDKELNDYTFAYERNTSQLETLREQEQQMLTELDSDDETSRDATQDDLIAVRNQIRDLEEANTVIERDVNYSDVSIRLSEVISMDEEVEEELKTFSERLQVVWDDATENLVAAMQVVLLMLVTILPWGLVVTALVLPVLYVMKKRKKKMNEIEKQIK